MSDFEQNDQNNSEQEETSRTLAGLIPTHSTSTRQSRRDSQANVPSYSQVHSVSDGTDTELSCILCRNTMNEVFSTVCGHSFCYDCLDVYIKDFGECPLCYRIISRDEIFPNFQLNRLVELKNQIEENHISTYKSHDSYWDTLEKNIKRDPKSIALSLAHTFTYSDIQKLLQSILEVKNMMNHDDKNLKLDLLDTFLVKLKSKNDMIIQNLRLQNRYISSDLDTFTSEQSLRLMSSSNSSLNPFAPRRKRKFSEVTDTVKKTVEQSDREDQFTEEAEHEWNVISRARSDDINIHDLTTNTAISRIDKRFDDLKELYYTKMSPVDSNDIDENERQTRLDTFSSTMYDMTRYNTLEIKDTLYYADSTINTPIVSSIEFDRDDEFFAVGGIVKDIKIFDFNLTNHGPKDHRSTIHCPVTRINCDYKISCLSWSSYIKSQIASSDYQGIINVWDANTGQKMSRFAEHTKRAWSVDTSSRNPNMLASGSDDTTVKVWSLNSQASLFTFQHKGNICCAKFAPNNSNYLAVGGADHDILCYDLRSPSEPLHIYKGHQKAISYIKWMNDNELVSASTDNSLKLWDMESAQCLRTFKGHLNEKNFVGLSVTDDWIACGSETNKVYTYHKYSKTPIAQYSFPINNSTRRETVDNNPTYFISSVCWKRDRSKLVTANSKGVICVLQLK